MCIHIKAFKFNNNFDNSCDFIILLLIYFVLLVMKKFWFLILILLCSIFLVWCMKEEVVIDDCIFPDDCIEKIWDDTSLNNKYLTAFWTEPYRDIEISWWIAKLSSPILEIEWEEPVTIRQEWDDYLFTWEELDWKFEKKDCLDWWKWDIHYYTVWVAKFRDYYFEWCWDDEKWIKMTDEEYENSL